MSNCGLGGKKRKRKNWKRKEAKIFKLVVCVKNLSEQWAKRGG